MKAETGGVQSQAKDAWSPQKLGGWVGSSPGGSGEIGGFWRPELRENTLGYFKPPHFVAISSAALSNLPIQRASVLFPLCLNIQKKPSLLRNLPLGLLPETQTSSLTKQQGH